ncbi:MAG: phosphoribosyltransferase [Lachnospiraceae bacterium]
MAAFEDTMKKYVSKLDPNVILKVYEGHFATVHSHITKYIDFSTIKARRSEAMGAANILADKYVNTTIVDTILCMEGCEVIGAYLADKLTRNGIMSMNAHKTIYVVSPEVGTGGQMVFRDNMEMMIRGKNVLLLVASASTGGTIFQSVECIEYYGGKIAGISAIFSATPKVGNHEVNSIFTDRDIPGYGIYKMKDCPYCKNKQKLDAIVNAYGYSKL